MSKSKISSADHVDNHRRLLLLSVFLLSLIFGVKAGFYFAEGELKEYMTIAAKSLFVLFAITIVVTIFWKLRFIPRHERYQLLSSTDSFANQMMNKACNVSWIATLIFLFFISSIIDKDRSAFPAQFYIDLTVFFMLAIFSVSFFVLYHSNGKGDHQHAGI